MIPLWSKKYIDRFLSHHWENLSSSLDTLPSFEKVILCFLCDDEAKKILLEKKITDIDHEFFVFTPDPTNAYRSLEIATNIFLENSEIGDVLFIVTADMYFSENVLLNCYRRLSEHNVVLAPCLRLSEEKIDSGKKYILRNMSEDIFLKFMINNLHRITLASSMTSYDFFTAPTQALFVTEYGYCGRFAVMHPLAIKVTGTFDWRSKLYTFDHSLALSQITTDSQIYVNKSLEDGLIASESPNFYKQDFDFIKINGPNARLREVCNWAHNGWALKFHIWQMKQEIRVVIKDNSIETSGCEIFFSLLGSMLDRLIDQEELDARDLRRPINRFRSVIMEIAHLVGRIKNSDFRR